MNLVFMSIVNALLAIGVLWLFLRAGRMIYANHSEKKYAFVRVFFELIIVLLGAGILLVLLGVFATVFFGGVEIASEFIMGDAYDSSNMEDFSKFKGGNFLLLLTLLIMGASLIHVRIRTKLRGRLRVFQLSEDEYDIIEYFIQWLTIFLAVYQFMFDGLQSVVVFLDSAQTAQEFFNIVLSPRNINIVVQPLLISGWMTIGIEKLRARQAHHQIKES